MGLFDKKIDRTYDTTTVHTEDELDAAIQNGYGTIYPTGPLEETIVKRFKNRDLKNAGAAVSAIASFAIPVMIVPAFVLYFSNASISKYNLCMTDENQYYFKLKKLCKK